MTALIVEMLEAALGGDEDRALRLAEEAGVSRFEVTMLRRNYVREMDAAEDAVEEAYERGHEEGWAAAVEEMNATATAVKETVGEMADQLLSMVKKAS